MPSSEPTVSVSELGVPALTVAFTGIDRLGCHCRIAPDVSVLRFGGRAAGDDGVAGDDQAVVLGDRVSLYNGCRLVLGDPGQHPDTGMLIGNDVIVNVQCYLSGEGGLRIDDQVLIGPQVKLLSAGHAIDGGPAAVWDNPLSYGRIHIKTGAWVAAGASVLEGVTIGRGAVVGAASVVTRDVPDYAVVAGNPARLVRYRDGFAPSPTPSSPSSQTRRRWWHRR